MRVLVRSRDASGTHFGGTYYPFGRDVAVEADAILFRAIKAHPFLAVQVEPAPAPVDEVPAQMSEAARPNTNVTVMRRRR